MKVLVLFVVMLGSVLSTGCAVMVPAAGVTLFGSERDCEKKGDDQTVFSSLGCTGAKIRDAVMSPFAGDKKDSPATTPPKDVAPATAVTKPSKKKAPIIRKDRRKK